MGEEESYARVFIERRDSLNKNKILIRMEFGF